MRGKSKKPLKAIVFCALVVLGYGFYIAFSDSEETTPYQAKQPSDNAKHIRILPIHNAKFLAGQRFDFLVEITQNSVSDLGENSASQNSTSENISQNSINQNNANTAQVQVRINGKNAQDFFGKSPKVWSENGILSYRIDEVDLAEVGQYVVEVSHNGSKASVAYSVVSQKAQKQAKNVILLIGDGMSLQAKQIARILSKGINEGKYNDTLAMEKLQTMALITTSGYDSLTTDSANSASAYATGHKSVVNAMGVYADSTSDLFDDPKVENIVEILKRKTKKSIGLVTTANLTDATPAAFVAHTRQRYELNAIALDMFSAYHRVDVLLGGGIQNYAPKEQEQSKRKDSKDIIKMYENKGYAISYTKDDLKILESRVDKSEGVPKVLGLYHKNHLNVYLDREVLKDSSVLGKYDNQPNLMDMTNFALKALSKNKEGFFLMIEGASIDKELHKMDWQRAAYDTIEFDKAVQIAHNFAKQDKNTLIIVVADHAHGASITGTYYESDGKSGREAVRTYKHAIFPTFEDRDNDGFPDNPNAEVTLAVHFANHPDAHINYNLKQTPQMPTIEQNGKFVANPNAKGEWYQGNIPTFEDQEVHSADDVVLMSEGIGSEYFRGVMDNTEVFFGMMRAFGLDGR